MSRRELCKVSILDSSFSNVSVIESVISKNVFILMVKEFLADLISLLWNQGIMGYRSTFASPLLEFWMCTELRAYV